MPQRKGQHHYRAKTRYQGMTYATAQAMRERYWVDEWTQARIAREFGVGDGTVSRIINEYSWAPPMDESWSKYMPADGDMRAVRGNNKLTPELVRLIRQEYLPCYRGRGPTSIARKYGLPVGTVEDVCWDKTWRHVR